MPLLPHMPAPDEMALWRAIRNGITEEQLQSIADVDYGQGSEAHIRTLRAIRDTGRVVTESEYLKKHPLAECCEVGSNAGCNSPDLAQSFAIWILGRANHHHQWETIAYPAHIVQLVRSVLSESIETQLATAAFIAWLAEVDAQEYPRTIHAFCAACLMAKADPLIHHVEGNLEAVRQRFDTDLERHAGEIDGTLDWDVPFDADPRAIAHKLRELFAAGQIPYIEPMDWYNFSGLLPQLARETLVPLASKSEAVKWTVSALYWPDAAPPWLFKDAQNT